MIDQHKTLGEKFLKKGFRLYLFSFIIAPMGYIIKILLSNNLSVEEIGIIYGIISLVTIIGAFNDFGLTESIKHFVPIFIGENKYDNIKSILTYSFLIQIITSIIIALVFYFGANFIAINFFKSEIAANTLKIFSLFFIGINIFQLITTFLLAVQNTFYTKLIDLVRISFSLGFIAFVTILDIGNIIIYSWGWIIGLYIGILFGIFIFITKYYKKYLCDKKILWSRKLFLKISKYAIFVFLGAQAGTILSQIDMQMIIYLLGSKEAGYYTVYLNIIGIPFLFVTPLFQFLLPVFSELYGKKETNKIINLKKILSKNIIIIGIFIISFLFVFSELISFILFGENYIKSGTILHFSIFFIIFNFLLQVNFNILAGVGKVKERVKIIIIAIIINFTLNLILLKIIGVYGAALATGFGWIIIWLLSEKSLGNEYRINNNFKNIIKNILIFGVISTFTYLYVIKNIVFSGRLINLIYLLISFIIYFGIFILVNYSDLNKIILEIRKVKKG